ncbi:MAG TPA: flavin reductase family protein [Bryobacteraceae bacterium]|jgi:flavin reductase (DIM6/NTAB) family NADH-FMN oxidoreductase RutF|nr:flavin reductase family protein [Bryobacteraceae bacterium]
MSREGVHELAGPVSSDVFRCACGRFATGVAIAAAIDSRGVPHGLTVNSFASVSLEPPLVLICLSHAVAAIEIFRTATHFGLSVLRSSQRVLSERFAAPMDNRFDSLAWHPGKTGTPLLDDVLAQIECVIVNRVAAGDHDILIGEMVAARVNDGDPLIYFASQYRELT